MSALIAVEGIRGILGYEFDSCFEYKSLDMYRRGAGNVEYHDVKHCQS